MLLLAVLVASLYVNAQLKNLPKPETLNEVNWNKKPGNILQKLEKVAADFVNRKKVLGYGGSSTNFVINGEKSSLRISSSDSLSFLVTMADGTYDPSTRFVLIKAKIVKGKREAPYIKTGAMFTKSSKGDDQIAFTVKSHGNQLYEFIPEKKLEPGEYMFVNLTTLGNYGGRGADVFAFGID